MQKETLTESERNRLWNSGAQFKGLTFDECLKLCYNWTCQLMGARIIPDPVERREKLSLLEDINPLKLIGYPCANRMYELGITMKPEYPELNARGFFDFIREEMKREDTMRMMQDELLRRELWRNQSI